MSCRISHNELEFKDCFYSVLSDLKFKNERDFF